MKALELARIGDSIDGIRCVDRDPGAPGPGRVRVRMIAAPIHPSDLNWVDGTYHDALRRTVWNIGRADLAFDPERTRPIADPPYVLGVEGVGIVEAAGSGLLAKRLVGKRVAVSADGEGTYRDVTIVDAKRALPVPKSLSDEAASMLFVNPLSAYAIVHEVLGVRRGDSVIVTAAGSALGRMVIRLGRKHGFETIAVVRRPEQVDELLGVGATHAISVDPDALPGAVHDATRGLGARHALDCVGGALGSAVVRSLTLGGHAVLYGTLSREPIELAPRDLMMPVARVSGFFLPNWLAQQSLFTKLRVLREVTRAIGDGTLATEVAATFPLDRHREAFEAAMRPGQQGKMLFRMR